jgi:DNA-directed RNA polymerase sigma subunit (sigma70/sigma32)
MEAYRVRVAAQVLERTQRAVEIRAALEAGVTLATLSRKHLVTMERIRQIGKAATVPLKPPM